MWPLEWEETGVPRKPTYPDEGSRYSTSETFFLALFTAGWAILDGQTFDVKRDWVNGKPAPFGYDYWYQPKHNVMVSTAFGIPRVFREGFFMDHVEKGEKKNTY